MCDLNINIINTRINMLKKKLLLAYSFEVQTVVYDKYLLKIKTLIVY